MADVLICRYTSVSMPGLEGFFLFIDLYKPFQELSMHAKIVIGVKNDDLFEYEVEKVIRQKAALNAPFLRIFQNSQIPKFLARLKLRKSRAMVKGTMCVIRM